MTRTHNPPPFIDDASALDRVARNWKANSTIHNGKSDTAADAIVQTWADVTGQTWQAAYQEISKWDTPMTLEEKQKAQQALLDILSDTDEMLFGNGCDSNGAMYPDVIEGLNIALRHIVPHETKED
jgi:hypothetical protein